MKQYQKPEVNYENFALAEHIAMCDYQIGSGDPIQCKIIKDNYDGDGADFVNGFAETEPHVTKCDFIVPNYCYTNGADMPKFSSPDPLWNRSLSPSQAVISSLF